MGKGKGKEKVGGVDRDGDGCWERLNFVCMSHSCVRSVIHGPAERSTEGVEADREIC